MEVGERDLGMGVMIADASVMDYGHIRHVPVIESPSVGGTLGLGRTLPTSFLFSFLLSFVHPHLMRAVGMFSFLIYINT